MSEYYYCKSRKKWMEIRWSFSYDGSVSDEKANELRNARSNKKFVIVKNRYGSIRTKYIYIDIENFKLNLNKGKHFYFVSKEEHSTSRSIYFAEDIKNLSTILKTPEDVSFASDYVHTCATSRSRSYSNTENKELKDKAISELSDLARFYYEIDPRPPFKI